MSPNLAPLSDAGAGPPGPGLVAGRPGLGEGSLHPKTQVQSCALWRDVAGASGCPVTQGRAEGPC